MRAGRSGAAHGTRTRLTLKTDLPGRIRAAYHIPIVHITSPPEPAPGENALKLVPLFAAPSKRRIRALARASVVAECRDENAVVKAGTSGSDLFVISTVL